MDINKMRDISREQFEAWVQREWPEQSLSRFTTGEYQGFTVEHCWQSWISSRAAVSVDLPPHDEFRCDTSWEEARQEAYNRALDESRAAIEALGLKVNP